MIISRSTVSLSFKADPVLSYPPPKSLINTCTAVSIFGLALTDPLAISWEGLLPTFIICQPNSVNLSPKEEAAPLTVVPFNTLTLYSFLSTIGVGVGVKVGAGVGGGGGDEVTRFKPLNKRSEERRVGKESRS